MNSQNLFPRLIGIKKRIIRGEKCLSLIEQNFGKPKSIIRPRKGGKCVIFVLENEKQIIVDLKIIVDPNNFTIYENAIISR